MLVIDVIESEINCKPVESHRSDSHYWSRRRAWWRAHKAETGCGWDGVQESLRSAADYLASLRQRAAMSISEAVADEQSEPNTEIRGEYGDLSGSFAAACREADAARRNPRPRARRDFLPTSTCITLDWLLRYCDAERLRKFLEGRPEAELAKIKNYIAWKNPNDQQHH